MKILIIITAFAIILIVVALFNMDQLSSEKNEYQTSIVLDTLGNDSNSLDVDLKHGTDIPMEIFCLLNAYPEYLDSANGFQIFWKDGTNMKYNVNDDWDEIVLMTDSEFDKRLNDVDLFDQVKYCYPINYSEENIKKNFDPGRFRYEPFFKKMYGNSKDRVRKNLTNIKWLPNSINKIFWVSKVNDIDKKIIAISEELEKLPKEFLKYVDNPAGTFVWRIVAGTERLSPHSYGIAIDINVKYSNYWRWAEPNEDGYYSYDNQIPFEIVSLFEKYGFIWGGKWYHFDSMHFEYRPELLMKNCECNSKKSDL